MWKPGTRIEKWRDIKPNRSVLNIPIGAVATVVAGVSERTIEKSNDCDAMYEGRRFGIYSPNWRRIDTNDTTGITSVEQLVQSLSKVTA